MQFSCSSTWSYCKISAVESATDCVPRLSRSWRIRCCGSANHGKPFFEFGQCRVKRKR